MLSKRTSEELRDLAEDVEGPQTIEFQSPGGNTYTFQLTKGRANQLQQQQNEQQQGQQQQGQSGQQQQRVQEWRIRRIQQQSQQQQS